MKKPSMERKSRTSINQAKNREFAIVTYLFVGLFLILIAYFVYFQVVKSEDFINSPYKDRKSVV